MSNKKEPIPFHHFGGQGKMIHFAHANGYPPEGYRQFFSPFLKKHEIIGSKYKPLWSDQKPNTLKSWKAFGKDMIRFMDERGMRKVIGMGHSMGGSISVLVAHERPDLFERLILLDPVIFSYNRYLFTKLTPLSLLKKWVPPARLSIKRRNKWDSKKEVYQSWREKKVFKRFSDEVLQDYVDAAIVPTDTGGVTLAFPREWETQVYITAPYVFKKALQLQLPVTIIKAEQHSVITDKLWDTWQAKSGSTQFIEFKNAGHLLPMEYPEELAKLILTTVL